MGFNFNPVSAIKHAATAAVNTVEDGAMKFGDAMKGAAGTVEHAAEEVGHAAVSVQRGIDTVKNKVGTAIDNGEQWVEHKVDDGRNWLSEHGGVVGKAASAVIGFDEGVLKSVYEAGKGIVEIADGAGDLTNPLEWAANPGANIDRLKSTGAAIEGLGKIAALGIPIMWAVNPEGNAQTASALGHGIASAFEKDPSKAAGVAVGTIATLFIPGGGEAAAAGDVARGANMMRDTATMVDGANTVTHAAETGDALAHVAQTGETLSNTANTAKTLTEAADATKPLTTAVDGVQAAETGGTVAGDVGRTEQAAHGAGEAANVAPKATEAVDGARGVDRASEAGRAEEPTTADLDAYRARLGGPQGNTIAVGRTDVPGLESEIFEGASPEVRKAANLRDLNEVAPDRPIRSPQTSALYTRHAEEDLANNFVSKVEDAGLKPSDLDGKTLNIRISHASGVCRPSCMSGLGQGSTAAAGVIKQLSQMYPGLTVRIAAEGGNAYGRRAIVEILNGRIIN